MKKTIFIAIGMLLFNYGHSQLFKGKETYIHFFSKTSMKDIEAKSTNPVTVLKAETGDFQTSVQNKSFKFESAFMEEHFNENYIESEKFPFSTFKGKIQEKIDYSKNGEYTVTCKGIMDMHGVTKEIIIPGTLKVNGNEITIDAKFKIKIADFKIKVPALYAKEIAEEMDVDIKSVLEPFKK
jgi:hypothetical protein